MRNLALALLVLGAALALWASRPPPPPREPLRVALTVWPSYEMAYLAEDLGYLDGAAIEFADYAVPADAFRAFQNGSVDVVAFTIDYALLCLERDPETRIFMAINASNGGDALISTELSDPAELAGKRVGLEPSVLGALVLTRALESAKLPYSAVTTVPVEIPDGPAALREGKVDALVTFDPFLTRAIHADGARVLFSSAQMPGDIVDVGITRAAVLASHGDELRALRDGWYRAVTAFQADPERYAEALSRRQGLTAEQFLASFRGIELFDATANEALMQGTPAELERSVDRILQLMAERELIGTRPDTRRFVVRAP